MPASTSGPCLRITGSRRPQTGLKHRRLWKAQYRDRQGSPLAPARRRRYLYADEGLIAEATQAITLQADLTVTATAAPQIASQYGPRPDAPFTTGVLFVKTGDSNGQQTLAYLHHDHLGAPLQASDKQGQLLWAARDEPFGLASIITPQPTAERPTIALNLRLPGQLADQETGLHYNWNRYDDPVTGRYIQSDPIGLDGGINTYSYALNQPTKYTDPTGLLVPLVIPGLCAAGGCEALIVAGVMMSTPGKKAIKSIAQKIQDLCTPDDDPYDAQQAQEEFSCRKYWGHWSYDGCMERARIQGDMCRRKQPNPPPPWSDADVNGWAPPPAPRSRP